MKRKAASAAQEAARKNTKRKRASSRSGSKPGAATPSRRTIPKAIAKPTLSTTPIHCSNPSALVKRTADASTPQTEPSSGVPSQLEVSSTINKTGASSGCPSASTNKDGTSSRSVRDRNNRAHVNAERGKLCTSETVSGANDDVIKNIMRDNNVCADVAEKIAAVISNNKNTLDEDLDDEEVDRHLDEAEEEAQLSKVAKEVNGAKHGSRPPEGSEEEDGVLDVYDEEDLEDDESEEEDDNRGALTTVFHEDNDIERDHDVSINNDIPRRNGLESATPGSSGMIRTLPRDGETEVQPSTPLLPVVQRRLPYNNEANNGRRTSDTRVDESVLMFVVEMMKECVAENIKHAIGEMTKKLETDLKEVSKLKDHVTELANIVTTSASAMFIKQQTAPPRVNEIHNKICLLPALFSETFMFKILARCVLGLAYKHCSSASSTTTLQSGGIEIISILFFTRQPNEKWKEKFDSETGQKFSRFRNGVMLSAFLAMQDNKFNTFRIPLARNIPTSDSTNGDVLGAKGTIRDNQSVNAIQQPFWLQPGYVLTEHCLAAAVKFEKKSVVDTSDGSQSIADSESVDMGEPSGTATTTGKTKINRTGPITRDEIAVEASFLLYKIITSLLHSARLAGRLDLFQSVLYLFTGWAQYDAPVSQATLKLQWEAVCYPSIDFLASLPKTRNHRFHSNAIDNQQIDVDNLKILETVISDHPELSLLIEHDVLVDGKSRKLKTRISMIEVACKFFASYINGEMHAKAKETLCLDASALQMAVILGVGLRRLLEKAVADLNTQRSVLWASNSITKGKRGRPKTSRSSARGPSSADSSQYRFEDLGGISIETLMPARSKQKDLLTQMILCLSKEEFGSLNQGPLQSGNEHGPVKRIQPDDSLGIFAI